MSGKLVVAVILALHVTASLCEVHPPDQELVDKYMGLRDALFKRVAHYFDKTKHALEPLAAHLPEGQAAKDYVEDLQTKPHVQSIVKVATGVAGELTPLVDKARNAALGVYGEHVRPWAKPYLEEAITHIRNFLDHVLPVDE